MYLLQICKYLFFLLKLNKKSVEVLYVNVLSLTINVVLKIFSIFKNQVNSFFIKQKTIMSNRESSAIYKDYFNRNEAAEYMCVSVRAFQNMVNEFDIPSAKVTGGRIIYRRSDLQKLNEIYFNAPEIML